VILILSQSSRLTSRPCDVVHFHKVFPRQVYPLLCMLSSRFRMRVLGDMKDSDKSRLWHPFCPRFHKSKVLRSRNRNLFNLKGGGKNQAQQEIERFLFSKKHCSPRAPRSHSCYYPDNPHVLTLFVSREYHTVINMLTDPTICHISTLHATSSS